MTAEWKRGTLTTLAVLLTALPAQAQEKKTPPPANEPTISFGDLTVLQVLTASKSLESSTDAPGVISTITAAEIKAYGATNLLELLERLPSAYVIQNGTFPNGIISIRGVETPEVTNRVLVLLDGRPVRESTHGAMNMALFTAFPVGQIERIEMVRGPGSVLYGTNAFAGVLNIITKDADRTTANAQVGYGSFDARRVNSTFGIKAGDLSITGGAAYARDRDAETPGQPYNLSQYPIGGNLSVRYKGLTFASFAGKNFMPTPDPTASDMHTRLITADLGYERQIASWWNASANVTHNFVRNTFGFSEVASDFVFEQTNHFNPSTRLSFIVGGLAYRLSGGGREGRGDDVPALRGDAME